MLLSVAHARHGCGRLASLGHVHRCEMTPHISVADAVDLRTEMCHWQPTASFWSLKISVRPINRWNDQSIGRWGPSKPFIRARRIGCHKPTVGDHGRSCYHSDVFARNSQPRQTAAATAAGGARYSVAHVRRGICQINNPARVIHCLTAPLRIRLDL